MSKFNLKNLALVIICLSLFIITVPSLRATTFDNSDFVSELSSEELLAEELSEKQADLDQYNERIEKRTKYANFAGISAYNDEQEFTEYKTSLYESMEKQSRFSEEQKNQYYLLMFGENGNGSGIVNTINDFNKYLEEQNGREDVVIDTSAAVDLIINSGAPDLTIDNLDYITDLQNMIIQFPDLFVELKVSDASSEELNAARESNVLFTKLYTLKLNELEYLSIPKVKTINRFTNSQVIMNIGLLIAIIVLFAIRFPIIKKQQEYAWNKFRPITLLTIPLVGLVVFGFLTYFFGMNIALDSTSYDIYANGTLVTTSDRIYLNEQQSYKIDIVSVGSENSLATTSVYVNVSENPNQISGEQLEVLSYGGLGTTEFTTTTGNTINYQLTDDPYSYVSINNILLGLGFEASNTFEPDELLFPRYIETRRNVFVLPTNMVLIIPSLMFGTLYFMFLLMPKPMVKMYLNELYTINKFCGFLAYNMAYRSNARVLIEETLQSLEACKFSEDFAIIFFEKNRNMTDKIQDISQIYSYKFFEMYLGIVNIIFDEGVSESTLKSLSIIQQFGDEYYNQADMFFKSKRSAIGSLMMIIIICMVLPVLVRSNIGEMFLVYMNTDTGYTFTIGCYLVWFGIICLINNMYKNNKIVRKEGRYV